MQILVNNTNVISCGIHSRCLFSTFDNELSNSKFQVNIFHLRQVIFSSSYISMYIIHLKTFKSLIVHIVIISVSNICSFITYVCRFEMIVFIHQGGYS
jgi:hypothetical protein